MRITLPKDVIRMTPKRLPKGAASFRFYRDHSRMVVPMEIRDTFPGMGVDMFVSKSENSLYLTFGPKEKTQFSINKRNGYVGCKCLFDWFSNAGVTVMDKEEYEKYDIDKKEKIVRLKLVRK